MENLNEELIMQFILHAPVNIFFKVTECRYLFASEICHLVNGGEDGTIIGKTDLEIQNNKELGKLYYEDDKKILATGEGSDYVSEFPVENGESLYFEIKKNPVRDTKGKIIGVVGIVCDVTERIRLEKKVEELSIIDSLTGTFNRNYLNYKIENKKKLLKYPFTVIMSDCNCLKQVNDKYGHEDGDVLLKTIAAVLMEEAPHGSPVVRMDGDEFIILGNGISESDAKLLMDNVQNKLKIKSERTNIPLSLSMGSFTVENGDFSMEEIYHEADKKMYGTKKAFYQQSGNDRRSAR